MKTLTMAAVAAFIFGSLHLVAFAQKSGASAGGGTKLGVVDTRKIIEQLPEAKDAEEKIREVGLKYRDTLETIQKDFTAALEAFEKQQNMLSNEAKTKAQDNLRAIQERYQKYREEKLNINNPQSDLGRMQEELLAPIRKKVRDAIKDVSRDEKISAVLEAPAFIYYDEQMDITFRVLDKLKRNK
jgi:outer membrane protein